MLHTKGSQNKYGENMIQKSGPIIWNSVPEYIQDATSISSFKYQLKKQFIAQYDVDNTTSNNIYARNYVDNNIRRRINQNNNQNIINNNNRISHNINNNPINVFNQFDGIQEEFEIIWAL